MATRRMFSRLITETDRFLSMTPAAQSLYFHLNMNADDDGFVASPKAVLSATRARKQDLKMLEQEKLVLLFSSGILVITHWRVHNLIKKDRYHPTLYHAEKAQLLQSDGTIYGENEENLEPEVRLDKERQEESSPDQSMDTLDEEMFLSFWNAYPRKENLGDAKAVWKTLHVDDKLFEQILDAVQNQTHSVKWTTENGKYIPLPANWLKKESWHDELSLAKERLYREEDWGDFTDEEPFID